MTHAAAPPSADDDPVLADLIEQLTERAQAGEKIDESEVIRNHPEHAEALRELFPALRLLGDLSRSGPDTLNGLLAKSGSAETGMLGDFRILREVGRGGMGVVYEAEQITLGRRVALKVLPFAATMDPRHLQRFHNEARAAASLHHEHIVPVHNVGQERGLHYFAMQFIDGRTLAEMIRELGGENAPEPTVAAPGRGSTSRTSAGTRALTQRTNRTADHFRRAAEWGVQAAEALEHAHAQGIVHRDIKPGNLMVDFQGKLWVTDFGLARTANNDLTVTGDILGTLRYMSPEQALAKHGLVDHRTDVYSLGVTLYELLTLKPAVDGKDREEILRQIAFEEPRAPRQLAPEVPRELETIILKAISKEPHLRYQSAEEFAEDLRRFLADQPIKARRTTTWQLLMRWRRRNPGLAAALVALAGIFVAVTVLVTWQWRRERIARSDAQSAEARATRRAEELLSSLYFQSIARADQEWWANNVGRAETVLDRCPPELRHWEWRHLKRLCHGELLTLRGHEGAVNAVTRAPDGRHIASGGEDGTVRIWDLETGGEAMCLRGHRHRVVSLVYSPDGKRLASSAGQWDGPNFGEIKIWDVASGKEIANFPQRIGLAGQLAFSPDGHLLAIAGWEGAVRLIDLVAMKERPRAIPLGSTVKAIAFSPDGRTLAAGTHSGAIKIWDVQSGVLVRSLPDGHTSDVLCLAFSPDGSLLLSGGWDHTVRIWNPGPGLLIQTLAAHTDIVRDVAFAPDGSTFASSSADGTIRLWQTRNWKMRDTLRGHSREVSSITFSPGGNTLISSGWDGTVKVWDLTQQQFCREFSVVISYQRRVVYRPDGQVYVMATRPSGGRRQVGLLAFHDGRTGTLRQRLAERDDGFNSAAFDRDGQWLACDWGDKIALFNAQTGREVRTFGNHAARVSAVTFVRDYALLAAGDESGTVTLWNPETGDPLGEFNPGRGAIQALAASDDGRWLAVAGTDGRIAVRDLTHATWAPLLAGHVDGVHALAFRPGTHELASAGRDGAVRLWNVANGSPGHVLNGHVGPVTSLSFTGDGQRLASGGIDGAVVVWDPDGGQEALTLRRQLRGVSTLAFRPDGTAMMALSADGNFGRLWEGSEPRPVDWPSRRSEWHRTESTGAERIRNWPVALYHLDRLLDRSPDDYTLLVRRGTVHAEMNSLGAALADFRRAVERPSGDPHDVTYLLHCWYHAFLLLITGDERGYLEACQRLAMSLAPEEGGLLAGRIAACLRYATDSDSRQQALVLAERGVENHPKDVEMVFGHAIALMRAGRAEEAVARLAEAIRLADAQRRPGRVVWPPSVTSWLWQAIMLQRAGRSAAARLNLDRAEEWIECHLDSGETPPGWRRPPTWLERAELRRLLREAQELIDTEPRRLARAALQRRDWAAAAKQYDRLIAVDGPSAADLLARGRCHVELGRWDRAAADHTAACNLDPNSIDLWYRRAIAHLGGGDEEAYRRTCAEMFKRFESLKNADHVSHMTYCLLAGEQSPQVRAHLGKLASQGAKSFPGNERLLGAALYRIGDYEGAIRAFEQSAVLYSPRAWDWLFLAMCHHQLGQDAQARAYLKRARAWIVEAERLRAEHRRGGWFFWQERVEVLHLRQEAEALIR